jgi:hypothetical protein
MNRLQPTKGYVEALRHVGPETEYFVKWKFNSEQEAIEFVQSLMPKLTKVEWMFVPSNIESLEYAIVSKDEPDKVLVIGWEYELPDRVELPFQCVSNAWAYLVSLRVNGKVVSRSIGGQISSYLTESFLKGNPEIVEISTRSIT